jgi:glyoxylase I family protein
VDTPGEARSDDRQSAHPALHHLAVGSADVERLAAFYRELIGLREIARHHTGDGRLRSIWLDLRGAILMIEHTDKPARRVEATDAGPFLLAFRVSRAELRHKEAELEAKGYPIEARTPFTSYCRDVDGNRVGLSHYPEPRDGDA